MHMHDGPTTLGEGVVARQVTSPEQFTKYLARNHSLYSDDAIDSVSKKLLPHLDEMLAAHKTVFDPKFRDMYLNVVGEALPGRDTAPALTLRTMAALYESAFTHDYLNFRKKIRTGSSWEFSDLSSEKGWERLNVSPHLSALVLFDPAHDGALKNFVRMFAKKDFAALQKLAKKGLPFIYAASRTNNSWVYVVGAKPGDEANVQLTKLADEKASFSGELK